MTGDRPLALTDRRRLTSPGMRRAVNRAAMRVRCPACNRSGSLTRQAGTAGGCWACGALFSLQPVCELRPHPWNEGRPPRWFCTVHPVRTSL